MKRKPAIGGLVGASPAPADRPEFKDAKWDKDSLVGCSFCGTHFPESLGKYGCPNCHGEGLKE